MKKILLTLVMLISMSMTTFADDKPVIDRIVTETRTESVTTASKYDFTVNYRRLGTCLGLTLKQIELLETYFDIFRSDMLTAYYECDGETRDDAVKSAISKNLRAMKYILTDKQYKNYLLLMQTTLNNRGFIALH